MECHKIEILRNKHTFLCDYIDLQNTCVLDELYQSNVITSDEFDEIKAKYPKREQTATLLSILKRTDPILQPYECFIRALNEPYGFIVSVLQNSSHIKQRHYKCQNCDVCSYCAFVRNLEPRQILDILYQDRIISDDVREEIYSQSTRRRRVEKLFEVLRSATNPNRSFKVFLDHLPYKHQYLKPKGNNVVVERLVKCCCTKTKSKNFIDGGSKQNIPAFNSQDSIASLTTSVRKCLPYSSNQVKQLGVLWNTLWHCREQGRWAQLDQITREYFEEYSGDPDALALLYRSEMGTWVFYRNDYDKASTCFENAMDILPFTKMYSWHMGRILAIRIAMCVKQGQYYDAQSCVVKARQTTAMLPPCLATGTVNVFEGLYLSSLLLHSPEDKKSNEIKERAKFCFLSAIRDYETVNSFEIQSFLSEIYIFLAMLELGLDLKMINGRFTERRNSLPSEKPMFADVERNLRYFENNCWGVATNWSKMLFHIVKGEQHKQLDNTELSKKCYEDAHIWGMKGNFMNQLPFITNNIDMLKEKMEAKRLIESCLFTGTQVRIAVRAYPTNQ